MKKLKRNFNNGNCQITEHSYEEASRMTRITDVKTICLSRLHEIERQWTSSNFKTIKADCAIVSIETDSGLQGIGEACAYGEPKVIADWVGWYRRQLVGRRVDDFQSWPHTNDRNWGHDTAVAGIDCAVWDLRGKIENKRVSELISDSPDDRVRMYASGGVNYDWRHNPESLIEEVLGYQRDGFTASKVRIGTEWSWDGVTPDRFLGLMRDLRSAVGDEMELMVDGNQRLTVDEGLFIAHGLSDLNFTWFEEPIPQDDIDGYVKINGSVEIAITGGEQFATLERFRPYIERRAYDIVQPDCGIAGLSESIKIAEYANDFGIDTCPHSWHNGLMAMAHAHFVAALPNPRVVEICMPQGPLQSAIISGGLPINDGSLQLPEQPGFGVEIPDNLEEEFPFIEGSYAIVMNRLPLFQSGR